MSKDDEKYTSPLAQNIDATRKILTSDKPITVIFLISVLFFGGMWYFQVQTTRDSMRELISEIKEMNKQMALQNERMEKGFDAIWVELRNKRFHN